jgi:hypothetical protein
MDAEAAARREVRNLGLLAAWTAAWVGSLALASFGPRFLWNQDPVLGWAAIAANLVVGVTWIVVHARFLRGGGELERKIMMDAIAVALGVGLVGGFAIGAAENAQLVSIEGDIAVLSVLISVAYIIAVGVGRLRYR